MDELDWFVKWTEPALATRLRNRALVSIGVATARRPIELVRINLGDATSLDDGAGWKLVYRRHKSALDGSAPIERDVVHLGDDRSSCGHGCPACTLDSWLALYDRRWHLQADCPCSHPCTATRTAPPGSAPSASTRSFTPYGPNTVTTRRRESLGGACESAALLGRGWHTCLCRTSPTRSPATRTSTRCTCTCAQLIHLAMRTVFPCDGSRLATPSPRQQRSRPCRRHLGEHPQESP